MAPTGDEARASGRSSTAPDGEAWDDAEWVEVGPDNRWSPTFEERSRSALALAVLVGAMLLVAAFASLGGGGDDDADDGGDQEVAASASTATTEASTTTTEAPDPVSVDGEDPPGECVFDDRGASPLRDRADVTVLVLNGTPRGGHAGSTTEDLEDMGYTSMTPDNATIRSTSSVEYLPGHCAEAIRLVDDLGVATTSVGPHDPDDDDVFVGRAVLVLKLGRDSV